MCSDCHVALVEEVPTELHEEFIEYGEVMFTFHPGDIAFIKSLLDGEDIAYYFQGEQFNYIQPLAVPEKRNRSKNSFCRTEGFSR
jgi:hypothetical protein